MHTVVIVIHMHILCCTQRSDNHSHAYCCTHTHMHTVHKEVMVIHMHTVVSDSHMHTVCVHKEVIVIHKK